MTGPITMPGDGYEIDFYGHYTPKEDGTNADFVTVLAEINGTNVLPLLIEHGILNDYEEKILIELL